MKDAATRLMNMYRAGTARRLLSILRRHRAAGLIQKRWRIYVDSNDFNRCRAAAVLLQQLYRTRKNRSVFSSKLAKCVEEARLDNDVKVLAERLLLAAKSDMQNESTRELVNESALMLTNLRRRMHDLRREKSDQNTALHHLKKDKDRLKHQFLNADHNLASTQMRLMTVLSQNAAAKTEIMTKAKNIVSLKREVKNMESALSSHNEEMKRVYAAKLKSYAADRHNLNERFKVRETQLERQKTNLQQQLQDLRKTYQNQIQHITEKMKNLERNCQLHINSFIDAQRKTRAKNESLIKKQEEDIVALKQETNILRNEIEFLKLTHECDLSKLRSEAESARAEVKSIKDAEAAIIFTLERELDNRQKQLEYIQDKHENTFI
eukprot:CAMPEP_0172500464 /NCGR_PEP_ID=MMETSP1066-20121228/138810_1 /TAXON_ID=671091 /ORGANISM="Coscinodiscus wailesii, Strain CCMP2513" /LENGTH=378 /DNA_ID=CAMNT_0013274719 /DNA_START=455 /DNA_END=1591 /DNA_ORIENTATION=-